MYNHFEVGCSFNAAVIDTDESILFETGYFHNTVLRTGLLQLFDYSVLDMCSFINIGSSSIPPNEQQTQLLSHKFSSCVKASPDKFFKPFDISECVLPNFNEIELTYKFLPGTCTGDFTELGLSRLHNAEYFNRQLFKDENNNPIILRIDKTKGLLITCKLRLYCRNINLFGQIFKLQTFSATGGSITLKADNEVTFSVDDLNGNKQLLTKKFNQLFVEQEYGFMTVCGNTKDGFCLASPIIREYGPSFPLTQPIITHNNLIGTTNRPTLQIIQEYDKDVLLPVRSFSIEEDDTIIEKFFRKVVPIHAGPDGRYLPWNTAYPNYVGGFILSVPIKDIKFSVHESIFQDGVVSQDVTIEQHPSLDNMMTSFKVSYPSGSFKDKITKIQAIQMCIHQKSCGYSLEFEPGSEISVNDTDSFEFTCQISWGSLKMQ